MPPARRQADSVDRLAEIPAESYVYVMNVNATTVRTTKLTQPANSVQAVAGKQGPGCGCHDHPAKHQAHGQKPVKR